MRPPDAYDLAIIGGGINGCGIAADAAGRGLTVLLADMGDLGGATSSASSKLVHGGLRYLEHYAFRLVREALGEREVLLAKAPHIIWPLRFVLPHMPGQRPAWMLRAGLFLYDHLYRRKAVPGSAALDLTREPGGRPLKPELTRGFAYWDCWVDDARLVILNAQAAAERGAEILPRHQVTAVRAEGALWRIMIRNGAQEREIRARALVNAAGPWVDKVGGLIDSAAAPRLRLVKGSHVIVPRIAGADDAYLMQNTDGRIVFALPYEEHFTLIGTTDVAYDGDPASVTIDESEIAYLLDLASRFFRTPLQRQEVVWAYSGVRPLYDDQSDNPSAVTRDYHLELTASAGVPPLLTVMGGKVTTYRRLAEEALERLRPHLAGMGPAWTAGAPLPGGDLVESGRLAASPVAAFQQFVVRLGQQYPGFERPYLVRLARRHGARVPAVIGDARSLADMGALLGPSLTEREVVYLKEHEWAASAEDILWRRTKAGLHLGADERARVMDAIAALL
ncbi:glycerol-3-phosphate dehydrogenase [Hyphomicrobium sp. CS1BSMeth3]|uniref:glycerol-3-phosphate dehydrogenase n=1 Tax=Hyphomicrobium sp. CS1BSMeth3 TaxID=1892844 RepID=UPI0009304D58|nr:glycerol-3-phosphate dehydrogenase [Hyphomicrobium sp. CS1BSMeth3]